MTSGGRASPTPRCRPTARPRMPRPVPRPFGSVSSGSHDSRLDQVLPVPTGRPRRANTEHLFSSSDVLIKASEPKCNSNDLPVFTGLSRSCSHRAFPARRPCSPIPACLHQPQNHPSVILVLIGTKEGCDSASGDLRRLGYHLSTNIVMSRSRGWGDSADARPLVGR